MYNVWNVCYMNLIMCFEFKGPYLELDYSCPTVIIHYTKIHKLNHLMIMTVLYKNHVIIIISCQ